jgi:hypothetical protein
MELAAHQSLTELMADLNKKAMMWRVNDEDNFEVISKD